MDNPDYQKAEQSVKTISELVPQVVQGNVTNSLIYIKKSTGPRSEPCETPKIFVWIQTFNIKQIMKYALFKDTNNFVT